MARKNSRFIAIEILHQLKRGRTPLPVLLEKVCSYHRVEGSDRAFAMNLVYGVLRNYQYLDKLIALLCRKPLKKLHPQVHQALAVGLYQIIFLDRIPDSAAVNETVNGAKQAKVPRRLHGFINGVLRQSIRMRNKLPPAEEREPSGHPLLNHPEWLTKRWADHFGEEEMLRICQQNNSRQPLTLRVNSTMLSREEYLQKCSTMQIEAVACRYGCDGILLPGYRGIIQDLPGYAKNWFHVQGEAAQLVTLLLQPWQKQGHYLDGCAGLGGKTIHLLQLLNNHQGWLTAAEPETHRLAMLKDTLKVLPGHERLSIFSGTLQDLAAQSPDPFSGILVDAPCSGTGVIGRQPDIRWQREEQEIKKYVARQLDLLNCAADLLQPGGVLVYATCSLEPEENSGLIETFLDQNPEFAADDPTPFLPDSARPLIREGFFQPRPSDQLDGFFGARLVRSEINA